MQSRICPAGVVNVNVVGGVLTLAGDAADNGVVITQIGQLRPATGSPRTPPPSSFPPPAGLTPAGQAQDFNGVTGGINASMGGGNDDALISGPSSTS